MGCSGGTGKGRWDGKGTTAISVTALAGCGRARDGRVGGERRCGCEVRDGSAADLTGRFLAWFLLGLYDPFRTPLGPAPRLVTISPLAGMLRKLRGTLAPPGGHKVPRRSLIGEGCGETARFPPELPRIPPVPGVSEAASASPGRIRDARDVPRQSATARSTGVERRRRGEVRPWSGTGVERRGREEVQVWRDSAAEKSGRGESRAPPRGPGRDAAHGGLRDVAGGN
jgi:hypothetical protein